MTTIDEEKENDVEYQKFMKERYRNLYIAYKEMEVYQRELADKYRTILNNPKAFYYNLIYKPQSEQNDNDTPKDQEASRTS